jgi:hypothetical protein
MSIIEWNVARVQSPTGCPLPGAAEQRAEEERARLAGDEA